MEKNDNQLKKVKDPYVILSLLSGAKESNAEVFVWKLIGNTKHLGQVRIESVRKTRNDFCIAPCDGQDSLVQDLIGGQTHVDLYIPESTLLLRCTLKQSDPPLRFYLTIPEFVAQVERRKSLRLNTYQSSEVKISFSKSVTLPRQITQHFLKDCFDISSGGFSFFISKLETKFFQEMDPISMLEIKAERWTTFVDAEVVKVREVEPDDHNGLTYKVLRVSCRFTRIDQVSRKYLEKYIFERIKNELRAIND